MNESTEPFLNNYEPGLYQIRIKGHLETRWVNWWCTAHDKTDLAHHRIVSKKVSNSKVASHFLSAATIALELSPTRARAAISLSDDTYEAGLSKIGRVSKQLKN